MIYIFAGVGGDGSTFYTTLGYMKHLMRVFQQKNLVANEDFSHDIHQQNSGAFFFKVVNIGT